MRFCTECGEQLDNDVRYCPSCGKPVEKNPEIRQQEFVGELRKCPNCGEAINAFVAICPSCGYEFSGVKSTNSLQNLSNKLLSIHDEKQRATLINSFPVPNTREDIMEFLILAASSISSAQSSVECDAWLSKLNQVYEKGKLVLRDKTDLERLEYIYKLGKNRLPKEKADKLDKRFFQIGVFLIVISLITFFAIIFTSDNGVLGNVRPFMMAVYMFCSGALSILYTKNKKTLTYLRVSYIYNIIVNAFFIKYATGHTAMVVLFICCLFLSLKLSPEISFNSSEEMIDNKQSASKNMIIAAAVAVALLIGTIGVSTLQEKNHRSQTITWKTDGLYSMIPEPETKTGRIIEDNDGKLYIELYNISEDEFESFKTNCEEKGFNLDASTSSSGYSAHNNQGYLLSMSYDDMRETLGVAVTENK